MEHPTFHIHDDDPTTDGGPPGWLAFAIVGLLYGGLVMLLLMSQLFL